MGAIDDIISYIRGITNWEKKYPGGEGIYHLFEIDLSTARENKKYEFEGDQLITTDCEAQAYLRLNNIKNDLIDLKVVRRIGSKFKQFYLTNSASAGKKLNILAGAGGIFSCNQPQLVDITRQNIDRIIIRDQDGGSESSETASRVIAGAGTEYDFVDISGKGSLRWFYINTSVKAGAYNVTPKIYIDGTLLKPALSFGGWSALGMDRNTRPFQLLQYSVPANFYSGSYYFEKGIVFDTSLKLSCQNTDLANQVVTCRWLYQLLT